MRHVREGRCTSDNFMGKYEYECESTSNKYVCEYKLGKVNAHQTETRAGLARQVTVAQAK